MKTSLELASTGYYDNLNRPLNTDEVRDFLDHDTVLHVSESSWDRTEDVEASFNARSIVIYLSRYNCRIHGIGRYTKLRELRVHRRCNRPLDSLEGLEKCSELHTLIIPHNGIRDLGPIAKLPIRCLDISGNPIRSFSGLDLSKLETLVIDSHQLRALGEVDELPSLTRLELDGQVRKNHPVLKILIAKNPSLRVRMLEHRQGTLRIIN